MRASALLCLPLAGILAAQTSGQAPSGEGGEFKFQAGTQLVLEMVSVTDKNGKAIEDLTARDFSITENGAPQAISVFEFQKFDEEAAAPAPPRPRTEATRDQIASEPAGVFGYRNRRLLVLYFDISSMDRPGRWRAAEGARKFVTNQMAPADLVAVMAFSQGALHVHTDFTASRDDLIRAIASVVIDNSDEESGAAFGQEDGEFNVFTTNRQLSGLQNAVAMLSHLNEKKSIVYFVSGVNFNGVQNLAQMRSLSNAAIRANVSIYTVDARGLIAEAPMGDASVASPGGIGMYTGASTMALASAREQSQDVLYAMAADTGGKALIDSNDLSAGIVQAQRGFSSYYILGYYTTNNALDGKFRRIVVSLKEYPSAKLDYRRGYFGGKEFGKFTTADKERQLEEALMLEDPVTDLTIAMEVNYFQLNRAEYYVPVVMKIPGSELARARRGGAERSRIDFIGEIKDEGGFTVQNIRDKVDIKLTDATAAELSRRPIEYDTGYTLLPGTYSIKVLARDDETGRIGTYLRTFVIPNLNKENKRIAISSVILSSQRIGLRDALYTAGKDKEQIANPLVQDGQKLIPSVTRVFGTGRDLYVYLQAYDLAVPAPQPLVAFVTFYRAGARVFETSPVQFEEVLNERLKTVPLKFSIGLGKLPPGKYDLQVSVINPAARKAAFWKSSILLVP